MERARMTRRGTGTRRHDEEGVVLPAAIVILFVVGTLLVSMMTLAMSDTRRTGRSMTRTELRAAAESELDRAYALAVSNAELFDGTEPEVLARLDPLSLNRNWYQFDYDGKPTPCANVTNVCVRTAFATRQLADAGVLDRDLDGRTNEVLVEVEATARCDRQQGAGAAVTDREGCMTVRYQQRLRRRQFFDYVQFTDSEALAPTLYPTTGGVGIDATWAAGACGLDSTGNAARRAPEARRATADVRDPQCAVVSYQAWQADLIAGPIHTNDASAYVCVPAADSGLRVAFIGRLTTTGTNQAVVVPSDEGGQAGGCVPTGVDDAVATFTEDATHRVTHESVATLELPTSAALDVLRDIANRDTTAVTGSTIVTIDGSRVSIGSGPSRPLPSGGVIFVDGDVDVVQTSALNGKLTIATSQNLRVMTDLTAAGLTDAEWNAADPQAMQGEARDTALGLVAEQNIEIECVAAANASCAPRTLHAVLMSRNGAIFSDGWNPLTNGGKGQVAPGAAAPTLRIFGSVISRYRGVFGAYNPLNTSAVGLDPGALVQGFRKEFVYDPRLRVSQPPYLLQPVRAAWERLDLIEVPPNSDGLFVP